MRSVLSHFAPTLAALAVVAIPVVGSAQAQAPAQPNPAAEHLAAARSALNKVLNAPAPTGDAFKKLSEIKTEYIALERAASTASPEWNTHYAAIDRLLGDLIGGPAASGESGAVGTSGQAGAAKGLDPGIAANLQTFRTELKAFSTAMSGAAAPAANASTTSAVSAVSGSAPKPAPITAPAAPVSAAASSAAGATPNPSTAVTAPSTSASPATAPADTGLAAQIDPIIALLDAALAANAVDASGKVSVDRATLDAIKAQLQVLKAKKP